MKEGGYDHRDALFGVAPHGGAISLSLYYVPSDLCDFTALSGGYPERAIGPHGVMQLFPSPFMLMVDRGGCSFVQKVNLPGFPLLRLSRVFPDP